MTRPPSHKAVIFHELGTVTVIAAGTKAYCYRALVDWVVDHPLQGLDDPYVIGMSQRLEMIDLQLARLAKQTVEGMNMDIESKEGKTVGQVEGKREIKPFDKEDPQPDSKQFPPNVETK